MVSFRKCMLALTVLAIFASLASAQVGGTGGSQLTCATNVSTTPSLRSEGYTELTGDIVITCTGGQSLAPGALIPQVNIQVFLNTAVTSRLLPISNVSSSASEALLIIDEPGAAVTGPVPGYGPQAPQLVCGATGTYSLQSISGSTITNTAGDPTKGCTAYVGTAGQAVTGCATATANACATGGTTSTPAANIFQGIVSGNSVTFFGVPVLAPFTNGYSRVLRITNIRANASALAGGSAAGAAPVIASIAVSNTSVLPITNPTPTVGFVQSGLSASVGGTSNFNQCGSSTRAAVQLLTFTENFGTAFKTRVAAQSNSAYSGQFNNPAQNIPGNIYNSESGFIAPMPNGTTAGLADYGTRVKAVFSNIPAGIRLFVSTTSVNNAAVASFANVPTPPGGMNGNVGGTSYAQLVSSETVSDGNVSGNSGFFPSVASTDVPSTGNTPIVEVPVVNGSATAVWEVVNTNPAAIDSFKVATYFTYSANVAQNSPPAGTATVSLSYAPTPTAAFTASAGAAASSTLTIPRFTAATTAASSIANINICRTVLLYPYVTNVAGFDTGLAIANTSTDPFGTGPQAGSCKLNWYQGTNNPAQGDTGSIASGTVWTGLAQTLAPGFNGYMIAVCNFQYAHGFAFISDLGARNLAMGYLALVIPDPGTGSRSASPTCQNISGCTSNGENLGN